MIDRRSYFAFLLRSSFLLSLLVLGACGKEEHSAEKPSANQEISLSGAGATFPFPLYSKWMSEYNKLHPNVRINYQSIGSGGGIRQITSGTVDFGASDAPMSEADSKKAPGTLLHIPTTIGAVVVAYHIPGFNGQLKLDSQLLVDVFLGKVSNWSDPRIAALNPGTSLPQLPITVVYRTDGSGTTSVFTDYLSVAGAEWKTRVGAGKAVKWPVGLGAKGNEGVTGQLKSTPGAVGYVELAYATQNKLPMALLKNRAGQFVAASSKTGTAAAESRPMPDELFVSLADSEGESAYPIASYTYFLVYQEARDWAKGEALAKFLWWAVHEGQAFAATLDYAPLPAPVVERIEQRLRSLTFRGKTLLPQQ